MTKPTFAYGWLWRILEHLPEGDAYDEICDMMDEPWYKLTAAERDELRKYAEWLIKSGAR